MHCHDSSNRDGGMISITTCGKGFILCRGNGFVGMYEAYVNSKGKSSFFLQGLYILVNIYQVLCVLHPKNTKL